MPLEGLRRSRDSGSALYDTPPNGRSRTGWGVCHKSMAHPFRFSPFPRYGIEKKRFYLQQSPNFHKLGLCLSAKNVYLCRKLL